MTGSRIWKWILRNNYFRNVLSEATDEYEKVDVLNIFASHFIRKTCVWKALVPEMGNSWSKEEVLLVEEDEVTEHLGKVNIHKCMHLDGDPRSAEGARRCRCEVTFDSLGPIFMTGKIA